MMAIFIDSQNIESSSMRTNITVTMFEFPQRIENYDSNPPDNGPEAVDGIVRTVVIPKTEGPIPYIVDSTQKEAVVSPPLSESSPTGVATPTILGLRPRLLYIIIVAIVLSLAAVGAGVGGFIVHKHHVAKSPNTPQPAVTTSRSDVLGSQTTSSNALVTPTLLPRKIRQDSSLSTIDWGDGSDYQLRVYYQGDDGYIQESIFTDGSWNNKSTQLVKAKLGTPIASMFFPYDGGTEETLSVGHFQGLSR
jgi:hypothetical protein